MATLKAPGAPRASPAERAASEGADSEVERAVRRLNALCKKATFDFAIAVGRLIVDEFYGGNLVLWRERGPKAASFRKLARHPDLPMSASALYRSVAIYELCERMGISSWKHISTSHLRLVLPLPAEQQGALLQRAESEGWTVRRLQGEIASRDGGTATCSPPPVKGRSGLRSTIDTLALCVDDQSNSLIGAGDEEPPSPESAREYLTVLRRVREACNRMELALSRTVSGFQRAVQPGLAEPETDAWRGPELESGP